ncbi:MAG: DUF4124 domain-containing protein [Gammaproteobacteria bacterium]
MQNRFLTFGLICLLFTCGWAAAQNSPSKTYRWVDADGVTHFSDSPRPGSQNPSSDEYEIRAPNVSRSQYRRRPPRESDPRASNDSDGGPAAPPPTGYQQMQITSPREGETLWNIGGSLNVSVQLTPGLNEGHGVVIIMDGRVMTPQPVRSTSVNISGVYRGAHTVVAAVRSLDGQQHIASPPVRFIVQQSTVN